MSAKPHFDPQDLLQHETFVRELAGRLVRDEQAADDIAQQTWVAALQAPAQPLHSLRAWLATIVRRTAGKRSRGERRRLHREAHVASNDPAPSPDDILEREQARAAVVKAVLELPENHRTIIVLRWFEGLPPRAIAKRLDVPVETVRTRHRRAMQQLRDQLDRQTDGGRAAWAMLLAPLAAPSFAEAAGATASATSATTTFTGAILMSTNLKIGTAVAAMFALCCCLFWPPTDAPPPADNEAPAESSRTAKAQTGNLLPAATGTTTEQTNTREAAHARETVEGAPTAGTGIVLVNVRWGEDNTVAPGIPVELFIGSHNFSAVSNENGVARIQDVPPRRYFLVVKRPDGLDNYKKVTVVADQVLRVDMAVPSGLDLSGIVVNGDGRPIADAEIVIGDWGAATAIPMARTDEFGKFAMRDMATNCTVGARAPGMWPTALISMTGSVGASAEVRLVIDKVGARLAGIVLDEKGLPVAGATVRAGEARYEVIDFPDGSSGMHPAPAGMKTDEHGRFAFDALPAEPLQLEVRSKRHAPSVQTIALRAGGKEHVTVHLQPGVTVRGRVTTSDGKPVACYVTVSPKGKQAFDREHSRNASTHKDGSFEITGAPFGDITLDVRSDNGEVHHEMTATPGQEIDWNPVLASGNSLRGRLVDPDDKPVKAMVEVSAMVDGGMFFRMDFADEQGRFEITNIPKGARLRVAVKQGSYELAALVGIEPSDEEQLLRVPKLTATTIKGLVLDEHGAPLPNAEVRPIRVGYGGASSETSNKDTGAFLFEKLPIGDYSLTIEVAGYARMRLPTHTLADGDTWDLGGVQMIRGGTLRLGYVGDFVDLPEHHLKIRREGSIYSDRMKMEGGTGQSTLLTPGEYRLQVGGAGLAAKIVPFRIEDGVETKLDVPVTKGTKTTFHFSRAPKTDGRLPVVITNSTGAICHRDFAWRTNDGVVQMSASLAPGNYRVSATSRADADEALQGEVTFAVGDEETTVDVEMLDR